MLDKKTFCHTIEEIKKVNDKLDKLMNLNSSFCFGIVEEYSLQDELITLLEKSMNIPCHPSFGSTISWWVYETEFGRNHPNIDIRTKKGKKQYYLDTVEKLYDFCVEESKQNKGRH